MSHRAPAVDDLLLEAFKRAWRVTLDRTPDDSDARALIAWMHNRYRRVVAVLADPSAFAPGAERSARGQLVTALAEAHPGCGWENMDDPDYRIGLVCEHIQALYEALPYPSYY